MTLPGGVRAGTGRTGQPEDRGRPGLPDGAELRPPGVGHLPAGARAGPRHGRRVARRLGRPHHPGPDPQRPRHAPPAALPGRDRRRPARPPQQEGLPRPRLPARRDERAAAQRPRLAAARAGRVPPLDRRLGRPRHAGGHGRRSARARARPLRRLSHQAFEAPPRRRPGRQHRRGHRRGLVPLHRHRLRLHHARRGRAGHGAARPVGPERPGRGDDRALPPGRPARHQGPDARHAQRRARHPALLRDLRPPGSAGGCRPHLRPLPLRSHDGELRELQLVRPPGVDRALRRGRLLYGGRRALAAHRRRAVPGGRPPHLLQRALPRAAPQRRLRLRHLRGRHKRLPGGGHLRVALVLHDAGRRGAGAGGRVRLSSSTGTRSTCPSTSTARRRCASPTGRAWWSWGRSIPTRATRRCT